MPMRPQCVPAVMRHTRAHTAGTQGTPDIHIEPRAHVHLSEPPDPDDSISYG